MGSGDDIHNEITFLEMKEILAMWEEALGWMVEECERRKFIVDELMLDAMYKMQNGTYAKTP
jgi:cytochrome bd-type quinol oxidase subunit 1